MNTVRFSCCRCPHPAKVMRDNLPFCTDHWWAEVRGEWV